MKRNLTKKEIIVRREDIDRTFKEGQIYFSKDIKMIICEQALAYNRVMVIPIKNFGTAVKRNAVRRRIKEVYRLNKFNIKTSYDIIFVVHRQIEPSYNNINEKIIKLLKKADLFITTKEIE